MKYLGIDYGSKRVGTAVSDAEGKIAFPRAEVPNNEKLHRSLAAIVGQEGVGKIIVGDTRAFGGTQNPITPEAEAFTAKLRELTGIPVELAFEAGSSIEASRYAPRGEEHNDAAAAAIILQRYLDMHGPTVD